MLVNAETDKIEHNVCLVGHFPPNDQITLVDYNFNHRVAHLNICYAIEQYASSGLTWQLIRQILSTINSRRFITVHRKIV